MGRELSIYQIIHLPNYGFSSHSGEMQVLFVLKGAV